MTKLTDSVIYQQNIPQGKVAKVARQTMDKAKLCSLYHVEKDDIERNAYDKGVLICLCF